MKDGRRRFVRLTEIGVSSVVLSSMFFACESEPGSPFVMGPDAAPVELADGATDAPWPHDAATDAERDASTDAFVSVSADITTDFATTANPNGAWTYGYSLGDPTAADAGAMIVFGDVSNATPDIPSWYDSANSVLNAPAAWRNDSTSTLSGVAPGEFAMHPGNAGEYAIARWTAPVAGDYAITLQLKAGDSGDTNGLLLRNGVPLLTEATTSTDTVHELAVTLAAGDHLDVAVGSKGDFLFDSTPVHLTIRSGGVDP